MNDFKVNGLFFKKNYTIFIERKAHRTQTVPLGAFPMMTLSLMDDLKVTSLMIDFKVTTPWDDLNVTSLMDDPYFISLGDKL